MIGCEPLKLSVPESSFYRKAFLNKIYTLFGFDFLNLQNIEGESDLNFSQVRY